MIDQRQQVHLPPPSPRSPLLDASNNVIYKWTGMVTGQHTIQHDIQMDQNGTGNRSTHDTRWWWQGAKRETRDKTWPKRPKRRCRLLLVCILFQSNGESSSFLLFRDRFRSWICTKLVPGLAAMHISHRPRLQCLHCRCLLRLDTFNNTSTTTPVIDLDFNAFVVGVSHFQQHQHNNTSHQPQLQRLRRRCLLRLTLSTTPAPTSVVWSPSTTTFAFA